jgi:hypothetical protein
MGEKQKWSYKMFKLYREIEFQYDLKIFFNTPYLNYLTKNLI